MKTRINKYLAKTGLGSRRKIDELIERGEVFINGHKARLGMKIDPQQDEIKYKNKVVSAEQDEREELEYWILNKPVGVVSTASDPQGRQTVLSFVKNKTDKRLFPVGRLDVDSEGLILLTNDGKLTYKLTHPKFQVEKEYLVWARGKLSSAGLNRLRRGVRLKDGKTMAAEVEMLEKEDKEIHFRIVIREGRNRQVRRMAKAVSLYVTRLQRIRMGKMELGDLQPGQVKKVSYKEIHG